MHPDARAAAVAATQQNLISVRQLHAIGLGRRAIAHRVRRGRLHPKHRGVYSLGTPSLPPLGRERAALLAVGDDAALSHQSAAAVWGLLPFDASGPVHVTTARQRRSRDGVVVHRANVEGQTTERRGLPLTAAARTIIDLERGMDEAALERLLADAAAARLIDPSRWSGAPPRIAELLADDPRRTRSEAERALLVLIARAGLPRPRTNARVAGFEVDAVWPEHRLVVEVDGFAHHGHRRAFERDRTRDLALQAAGFRTIRVTWRQLTRAPESVVAAIAAALALSRAA